MPTDNKDTRPDNPLAFPRLAELVTHDNAASHTKIYNATNVGGMTLRDYFAAKAMSAWIADGAIGRVCEMDPSKRFAHAYQQIAESSFGIADAMLKERAK